MYVARLDRPWLETPYKVQGILIRDDKDIERLMQYCNFVYVDTEKSHSDLAQGTPPRAALTDEEQKYLLIGAKPRQFEKRSQFNEELKIAFTEHAVLGNAIKGVMERVAQDNHLDLPSLNKAILPMVESVIRNPDAFSWLAMMKKRDDYAYNHSISSSIWAAAFGRNLRSNSISSKSMSTTASRS
jgi:HD-GYP domain-containing protein (c-di-GMP phosphodiesterase class II)